MAWFSAALDISKKRLWNITKTLHVIVGTADLVRYALMVLLYYDLVESLLAIQTVSRNYLIFFICGMDIEYWLVSDVFSKGDSHQNCSLIVMPSLIGASVRLEQGTVTSLLEEKGTIKGVQYRTKAGEELTAYAPLTIVCDGCFSNLRRSLCNPKVREYLYQNFTAVNDWARL